MQQTCKTSFSLTLSAHYYVNVYCLNQHVAISFLKYYLTCTFFSSWYFLLSDERTAIQQTDQPISHSFIVMQNGKLSARPDLFGHRHQFSSFSAAHPAKQNKSVSKRFEWWESIKYLVWVSDVGNNKEHRDLENQ